jgi:hypothetical protein
MIREASASAARIIAVAAVWLAGCSPPPPAQKYSDSDAAPAKTAPASEEFAGVTLDAESQQRLGLELAPVGSTTSAAVAQGTAVVLDSAALTATLADLDAARTEAAAAHENFERLQRLYNDDGNASHQAVEAARSQWAAARARIATAEARARSDWGGQIFETQGSRSTLLDDLAGGRAVLLRAEFFGVLPAAAEQLDYALLGADPNDSAVQKVDFIGRSRAPAQAAAGPSVILSTTVVANHDATFRPGERLSVIAASRAGTRRPLVPAAAAFADGGLFWCYVARAAGRFDRIPLASIERVADGYPLSTGVAAGDRVVVRGAPLLLSLERGAGSVAETAADPE